MQVYKFVSWALWKKIHRIKTSTKTVDQTMLQRISILEIQMIIRQPRLTMRKSHDHQATPTHHVLHNYLHIVKVLFLCTSIQKRGDYKLKSQNLDIVRMWAMWYSIITSLIKPLRALGIEYRTCQKDIHDIIVWICYEMKLTPSYFCLL